MNPTFIKSFTAQEAIEGGRIIKAGGEDFKVSKADSATAPSIGISERLDTPQNGLVDVVQGGTVDVRAGGNIDFGDLLTADSQGRAVKAAPVSGSVMRIIGIAQADAALDDLFTCLIAPGVLNTP